MTSSARARELILAGLPTSEIAAVCGLRVTSVNRIRRQMAAATPRGRVPVPVPQEALDACQSGESARSVAARLGLTGAVLRRACRNAGIPLPKRPPPIQVKKLSSDTLTDAE
jgi:DNA invertase Pin-like site-specific DNA recombinase